MKDFKPIYANPGDEWPDHFECETCGQRVERGIVNISGHWVECAGKDFAQALLKTRTEKNEPLTLTDIQELKNKHL